MMPDNTCHFLAADFDDHDGIRNPLQDAQAYAQTCELQDIATYTLRSKSGVGYHVYTFYAEAVPAAKARCVAFAMLQEAGVIGPEITLSSFDRLFPNQDQQSGKGFGNLIALPLQGKAAAKGHTLFLDPETQYQDPYPKQLEILASIVRVSESKLDDIIAEWELTPGAVRATTHTPNGKDAVLETLKCEFLTWARANPTKVPEPLWYAMISNVIRIPGGFSLCHEFSRGHPGYSEEETTRKIHQALDASGPHTCE